MTVPLSHAEGSNEELLRRMLNDWRAVYGKAAEDFGRFFIKWGLVDIANRKGDNVQLNPKQFARYIAATAMAGFQAVLKERMKIEQERVSGN
jgi:hypothetical protein